MLSYFLNKWKSVPKILFYDIIYLCHDPTSLCCSSTRSVCVAPSVVQTNVVHSPTLNNGVLKFLSRIFAPKIGEKDSRAMPPSFICQYVTFKELERVVRFELTTCGLENRHSTNWTTLAFFTTTNLCICYFEDLDYLHFSHLSCVFFFAVFSWTFFLMGLTYFLSTPSPIVPICLTFLLLLFIFIF